MTKNMQIILGWGLAIAVMMSIFIGLPVLSGASTNIKDKARWQQRAGDLQNLSVEYYSGSNADKPTNAYAKTLARQHVDSSITNPYMLDSYITSDIPQQSQALVMQAKYMASEANCLAEAIYYEARSETVAGQKAVAEVVLNRVGHKAFPSNICAVVYQGAERTSGCQFSFACDGSNAKLPRGKHWAEAQAIAKHMMMGASAPTTNRATHYHTTGVSPKWAPSLRKLRQYDTHVFYRFMPRKRRLRPVSVAP